MQEVEVKPRAFFKHLIQVTDTPIELSWTFRTRKNNIKFGIFKEEVQRPTRTVHLHDWVPELDCVLPITHYQSSSNTIHGSMIANWPGYYYLIFDNSFSL